MRCQADDGRAEVGRRIVPELDHLRMLIERRLNDTALNASPSSMDDAHLVEAGGRGRVDVLRDHGWNIARRERVQVDLAVDGQLKRSVVVGHASLTGVRGLESGLRPRAGGLP